MPGLEDLYREIILDHYKNPRNRGELPTPPAVRSEGLNPLCGDEIALYLIVEDGIVQDIKVGGQGCSISQSSASMMTSAVKGKPTAEARQMIRAFKTMMGRSPSRRGQVPRSHQVRNARVEHLRPGSRPSRSGRLTFRERFPLY
jgi:nitrogen fixation protein NifU and related proteins